MTVPDVLENVRRLQAVYLDRDLPPATKVTKTRNTNITKAKVEVNLHLTQAAWWVEHVARHQGAANLRSEAGGGLRIQVSSLLNSSASLHLLIIFIIFT